MFALTDIIMESIVFAMEDQAHAFLVDIETGETIGVRKAGIVDDAANRPPGSLVSLPPWGSSDGFDLREGFLSGVRDPRAKRELSLALGRGKGVFKAFKEVLAAYPGVESAFREYKAKAMARVIRSWYDDLREARGLERLGSEPEETEDLLGSDLEFRVSELPENVLRILPLLYEAQEESGGIVPAAVAERETSRLREEFESGRPGYCAYSDDDSGGMLACAAAFVRRHEGRTYGSIEFLFVRADFRRMGLGSAMLDLLSESLAAAGIPLVVVDTPLVSEEFARSLSARGYIAYGIRAIAPRT